MNYYEMIVNVARMLNKPRVTKKELVATLSKITAALGKTLDMKKLGAAYREFTAASAPRIVYG
jgi:hypothetical protein